MKDKNSQVTDRMRADAVDPNLQEKVKALPAEGREAAVAQLLDDQTDSFFAMVAGKWRELKGRVLEIFVRSM